MKNGGDGLHGRGGRFGDGPAWVEAAQQHILDLLADHHAVVHPELESRLAEVGLPSGGPTGRLKFDPHIISEAVSGLKLLGVVEERLHGTKGGRAVPVLTLTNTRGRETAVQKAVRRKGMLYARFRLLAETAGDAGELVVRHSMGKAGTHLLPVEPGFREVRTMLNTPVRGPLDSGAWLFSVDRASGQPRVVGVPVEVKNRRQVLYPIHKEVHQLLAKAAVIQNANPGNALVPVLICRRAHARLFWMARDLGFRVHATERQFAFMPKNLDERKVSEVRQELQLSDLTVVPRSAADGELPTIRRFFRETLPNGAPSAALRWAVTASVIGPYSETLRDESVDSADRQEMIRGLRQELERAMFDAGFTDAFRTWSLPDLEE